MSDVAPLVSAFEEAKSDLIALVLSRSDTLPREYGWCVARASAAISDIVSLETKLSSMPSMPLRDRHAYICSLLLHSVNDYLQSLHDVAENRVIRSELLSDVEISYVTELNDLYHLLLHDVRPALCLSKPLDVLSLPAENAKIISSQSSVATENASPPASSSSLTASEDAEIEMDTFETMYLHRVREKVLKSGAVLEKRAFSAPQPRFLFLSQYQLICTESLYQPKFSLDLSAVRSVHTKGANGLVVQTKDKTYQMVAKDAEAWCTSIVGAMRELEEQMAVRAETATEPVEEKYDLTVTIQTMEGLCPNAKGRPDNPYFYIGVGNPEHFGQDRRNRQRSSTISGTRDPVFHEQFYMQLTASKEYCLDVRVYSEVKGMRQNFCYGSVAIPVEELFVSQHHTLSKAFEVRADPSSSHPSSSSSSSSSSSGGTANGNSDGSAPLSSSPPASSSLAHYPSSSTSLSSSTSPSSSDPGRVRVTIKLNNWIHNRLPPPRSVFVPAILTQKAFEVREKVPLVFSPKSQGKDKDIVGVLRDDWLIDAISRKKVYSLTKNSFFKREYLVGDENGPFARCFHKMKTLRKKKLRMYLMSGEWLFSMAGGCFDTRNYDNEVYVTNAAGNQVASILFGTETSLGKSEGEDGGRVLMVHMIDQQADPALVLMFGLYALRTLS
jgi:hypothetical protein